MAVWKHWRRKRRETQQSLFRQPHICRYALACHSEAIQCVVWVNEPHEQILWPGKKVGFEVVFASHGIKALTLFVVGLEGFDGTALAGQELKENSDVLLRLRQGARLSLRLTDSDNISRKTGLG